MSEYRYTLDELETNGFEVHALNTEQQDVLRRLSEEEFSLLVEIRSRLQDTAPEVMAHSEVAGAALF